MTEGMDIVVVGGDAADRDALVAQLAAAGLQSRALDQLRVDATALPDLIVITGDILEKVRCLAWIPETLGRLQARHGKFFILGNH